MEQTKETGYEDPNPDMGFISDSGILAVEQVSPNISLTGSGFLLCSNVVVARTGLQEYTTKEIPVQPGPDGSVKAIRTFAEVFRPESMASFEGTPVTIEHPMEMVTSLNWKRYAVGVVQNVRQQGSFLCADLLITDEQAIIKVQDQGLRYLSCGYHSKLEDNGDGTVEQQYIRGNHVAIVQNPRGGPVCAIQDSITTQPIINKEESLKGNQMSEEKLTLKDKFMQLIGLLDAEGTELPEIEEDMCDATEGNIEEIEHENEETNIEESIEEALKMCIARLDKLEAMNVQEIAYEEVEDSIEEEVTDSDPEEAKEANEEIEDEDAEGEYPIADSFTAVKSKAEILVPGMKLSVPVMDAKSSGYRGAIFDCKKQALNKLYATDSGKDMLDSILKGRTINKLTTDALDILFDSVAIVKASKNNSVVRPSQITDSTAVDKIAAINRIHKELNK